MTPEQLKASILQYAIQGKLVEQRPEEGTGKELYRQIQSEKQRLIKAGKIKKEKALPEIAEDEIPFDIPDSWKWVNISEMSLFQEGPGILAKDFRESGIPLIRIAGMQNDILSLDGCNYLDEEMVVNKWSHFRLDLGDILISTSASMDKICEVDEQTVGAIPYTGQIRFKMLGDVSKQYFKWFIKSPCYKKQIDNQKTGGMIKHYGPTHLKKMYIPLPPLAEQKRIVAKIEELLPYVDRYAAAYEKLEQFNAKFPEDMKKSILQYAIQGKLVEQRPEEGTGEELYHQIQTEKQRLIKEGKIKKEKPLAEIAEDEVPFDIPESWKWCRLSQVAILENGDRSSKYPVEKDYVEFGVPFFGAKDMEGSVMSFDNVRYISEKKFAELGNGKLQDKDFICLLRGSVGKCALFVADKRHQTGFICAQMVIVRCINTEICRYLANFLASPFYLRYIESKVTGTAVRQLPAKELGNVLIPLPPLAEQKRIVAKLEEILPLCERLK